jgi:eukaryotic-like serine/threonine-protein kinase
MLEPGVVVGGKYRLERPLGAGGMGAVWVARHTLLDVEIALKVMGPQLANVPEARSRFVREAKAVAQLKSPYIVQVHDFGGIDDMPYLAMELLSGEDLGSIIAHEQRLSLARTVEIASSVAKALRVAHEARIVHRDLKPTNIFLAKVGGEQVVKVLDFGIAKVLAGADAGTTTSGAIIGSPAYMSPEQARGGSLDERSDLWSLGAVVFEMLTGQQAFAGTTIGDVILKICSDDPPVATRLAPWLPSEVDSFFERVFERDPGRRYPTARAFVEALDKVAALDKGSAPALALARTEPRGRTVETQVFGSEPPQSAAISGPTIGTVSKPIRADAPTRSRSWLFAAALIALVAAAFYLQQRASGSASSSAPATSAAPSAPTPPAAPTAGGEAAATGTPTVSVSASAEPAAPVSAATDAVAERPRPTIPRANAGARVDKTPRPPASASAAPHATAAPIDPFSGIPVKALP